MGDRLTVARTSVAGFLSSALQIVKCMRCESEVDETSSHMAPTLAQITNNGEVIGGLLCMECGEAFKEWLKGGRDDDN